MRVIVGIAVLFISLSPAAAAERIIGLVSIPEAFGSGPCAAFEPQDVALHAAPADGKPIAFIHVNRNWSFAPHGGCDGLKVSVHRGTAREDLPTREFDYEAPGAIALEQHEGWIKIRLRNGVAWFKPSPVDRFMPLSDLYEEFVGVTAISKSFTARLVSAGDGARSDPARGDAVAGPRRRDHDEVGQDRAAEQFGAPPRTTGRRSDRHRMAAAARFERRADDGFIARLLRAMAKQAAAGFTVGSGWACAVLIGVRARIPPDR